MPLALLIIGLILIVSGVRNTHAALGAQLRSDLTGSNNFTGYALALLAVGALGYIDRLRAASNTFMALILISLLLSNRGFFQRFAQQWNAGPESINTATAQENVTSRWPEKAIPSTTATPFDKYKEGTLGSWLRDITRSFQKDYSGSTAGQMPGF